MYCSLRSALLLSIYLSVSRAYFANFRVTWQWNNDSKNCWHLMNNTLLFTCSRTFARLLGLECLCIRILVGALMVKCGGVSLEILHGKSWRGCHLTSMAPEGVSVFLCECVCVFALYRYICISNFIHYSTRHHRCIGVLVCMCMCCVKTSLLSIFLTLFTLTQKSRESFAAWKCECTKSTQTNKQTSLT